jgi:hypothetical protein
MTNMRALTLDEFAAWMLANGYYDVDEHTGSVTNLRRGTPVHPIAHPTGYRVVNLVYTRKIVRQVKLHRLIAVKVWGVVAIKDKQVGHRDHDKTNNTIVNLWLPETAAEHVAFDKPHRNLLMRNKQWPTKTSWPPCALCGDKDGRTCARTPDRITGARFGVEGSICRRCYGRLHERQRRQRRKAA